MSMAYAESKDPANLPMAKDILETLSMAYPNHSWWVRIDGGIVVIKHFAISGTVGMVKRYTALAHDSMVRRREVIMAAGELLERANLRRGGFQGEVVKSLEVDKGVKWRPAEIEIPVYH